TGTNGIDISGGCFAVNGTCLGGGGAGSVTQIDTTFPILGGPITTTGTIALAFGTTTANSWSEIQTFNNSVKIGASIGGVLDISYGSDKIATFDRIDSPAVNYLGFYSNIAGDSPIIYAGGADTNIDLEFIPKGNGRVTLPNGNNFSTTGTVFATTTNTDALTVNTTITAPAGFAGRSTTINGTALDADAELYTSGFEFTIATTTTMATTTQELTYQCTNDLTITKVSGFCSETATTTVGLDIRNEYTPKIAGSDVFDDLFEIGDYSATTTFTTTSCSAGQWINLDVDGYFIGSPLNCYLKVQFTNDD
ncbi:MAG: hypothetical protein K9M15_01575, partial [Candidatus Marinimicrobia bacterium]|nr:hypothetical protein [Candidatus Neomarinimicrobiota bacterium]